MRLELTYSLYVSRYLRKLSRDTERALQAVTFLCKSLSLQNFSKHASGKHVSVTLLHVTPQAIRGKRYRVSIGRIFILRTVDAPSATHV